MAKLNRHFSFCRPVKWWVLENVHDPARLQALCTAHERIAHLGLIENEEAAAEKWRLRKEPDRTHPKFYVDSQVKLYRSS